jgi:hypothetical protein
MRVIVKTMLVLAALVWAGTASAASITAIDRGGPESSVIYFPSDTVTVDIVMDGSDVSAIASMFFHVDFTDNLSLGPVTFFLPPAVYWGEFAGNGTVDEKGLFISLVDLTDQGMVIPPGQLIATMVFHVIEAGPGQAVVSPWFATGDAIGGSINDGFPNLTASFTTHAATIHTPEPTTAILLGLGMVGIAYAGRRR